MGNVTLEVSSALCYSTGTGHLKNGSDELWSGESREGEMERDLGRHGDSPRMGNSCQTNGPDPAQGSTSADPVAVTTLLVDVERICDRGNTCGNCIEQCDHTQVPHPAP